MNQAPADYDGGVIPDRDMRELYTPVEWYVAMWRERAFGVYSTQHPMVLAAIDRTLGAYVIGDRLDPVPPSGDERSWKRGTWALTTWRPDRWTDLWVECRSCRVVVDEVNRVNQERSRQ